LNRFSAWLCSVHWMVSSVLPSCTASGNFSCKWSINCSHQSALLCTQKQYLIVLCYLLFFKRRVLCYLSKYKNANKNRLRPLICMMVHGKGHNIIYMNILPLISKT
jgi:hypothetical protein